MERVKHLKIPNTTLSRNRSQSIDMIVMDEVSKHTLNTWNSVENTEINNSSFDSRLNNNNININNNNNNNNYNYPNSPILNNNINNNTIQNIVINNKLRSNSTNNLNFSNINNNNFNININNSLPHKDSISITPPISPRGLMNTAPNLSSFIAQHTPPPSPRLSIDNNNINNSNNNNHNHHNHGTTSSTKSLGSLNGSLGSLPNIFSSGSLTGNSSPIHTPNNTLNSSGTLYRNLSFGQKLNSSVDVSLSKSHSLNQSNISQLSSSGGPNGADPISKSTTTTTPHEIDVKDYKRKKKKENKTLKRFKKFLSSIILSNIWASLMILFILYIIFIDDIIGLCGSPSSNIQNYFILILKLLSMFFFLLDIIGNIICHRAQYFPRTIIFWLDVWSLLSIVPDIYMFFTDTALSSTYKVLSIGRYARIIRLCGCFLQVSFITYVYKKFFRRQGKVPLTSDELEIEASKLGEKLIRLTTNKLVLLVILVYFAGQLLVVDNVLPDRFLKSSIESLNFIYVNSNSNATSPQFSKYLNNFLNSDPNILYLSLNSIQLYENQKTINNLQLNSIYQFSFQNSILKFNNQDNLFQSSLLHLCFTIFTILIIMVINLFIVIDAYGLVINPLENVLAIVKFLSRQNAVMQKNNLITRQNRVDSVGTKSEDTTSSSVEDVEDPDEADYLLGMLNDIDDSLQAAKEKVEVESIQNSILKKDIEDLYVEKYILQVHLRSIMRKITIEDNIGFYLKKKQLALLSDTLPFSDELRFKSTEQNPENNIVTAGTLDALVDRLTISESHDLKFTNIFLLTFRKFMDPIELMERLVIRFCVTPTMELPEKELESNEQVEIWRKSKQEQIRVSVFNTIKLWISKYSWDFYSNPELIELFNNLIHRIMPFCKMDKYASHLEQFLKRKMSTYHQDPEFTPPKPLSSEDIAQMMVMDDRLLYNFDIHDVAVQITLIEFELFHAIKPQEFLDSAWTSKTKSKRAPNICRFIDHFNNVSFYLQTILVKSGKVKDRVSVLKKIIALGEAFVQLHNYYGAMEVLSSLESSAIARLHRTWEMLPAASSQQLQSLQKLLSPMGSFKEYRERLKSATSACIPYIGVFLSDLTFIHEGNPDYRESSLINFSKQKEIASIIISIQQYQNTYYYYEVNEKIKSQINLRGIDSESIWKMSLTAEPRR